MTYPTTPDGRYFVVRGRLWRCANPSLSLQIRKQLTLELMAARRAVGAAKRSGDPVAMKVARNAVDDAKVALGERGPVWWTYGTADFNRNMADNTPYAEWFAALT
jgi:hypothetical protein